MSVPGPAPHSTVEPHDSSVGGKLNWLRAAVLGANDGLLSTAGLVLGVAAATTDRPAILVAAAAQLSPGRVTPPRRCVPVWTATGVNMHPG